MINQTNDIDSLLAQIKSLPTLPTVYYQLLDIMNNPMVVSKEIAEVISYDQSTALRVLKAANSPMYSIYGGVSNITQAIAYLGFSEIKNLVIAITIFDFFDKHFQGNLINPIEFWKHSIATGIIARLIGKYLNVKNLEDFFLAGILHDIGKIAMLHLIPEKYSKAMEYSIENNVSHHEAELKILGFNHTVVGETLATKWNLPQDLVSVIKNHHIGYIEQYNNNRMLSTIHISSISALFLGLGFDDNTPIPQPNPKAWDKINLNTNFFSHNIQTIVQTYNDTIITIL